MIRDAFMNGKKRDQGVPLHSIRAQYHQLIDQGFPYLMSTPAFYFYSLLSFLLCSALRWPLQTMIYTTRLLPISLIG